METYINAYIHICRVKSLKFVVVEADGHVTRSEVTFGSNLKDFCGFFPRRNLTPLLFVDHYFWLLITIFWRVSIQSLHRLFSAFLSI